MVDYGLLSFPVLRPVEVDDFAAANLPCSQDPESC